MKPGRPNGAKNKPKFVDVSFDELEKRFKGQMKIPVEIEFVKNIMGFKIAEDQTRVEDADNKIPMTIHNF